MPVMTNILIKVSTTSSLINFSESAYHDTFSIIESVSTMDGSALMRKVNNLVAKRFDQDAQQKQICVRVDLKERRENENSHGYWYTLGIMPYERVVEEMSIVRVESGSKSLESVMHVRCDGRRSAFSPLGLLAADRPEDVAFTQIIRGVSWRDVLGSWFPAFDPATSADVFAADLAEVVLSGITESRMF